jgi:hypothetical protein
LSVNTTSPHWSRKRILAWLFAIGLVAVILFRTVHHRSDQPATVRLEDIQRALVAPAWDGTYPCVFASVSGKQTAPVIGKCATPTTHIGTVDRFEVDLRYGNFVLRQTDLRIDDVFDVPLTRSYDSGEWFASNLQHAFGHNSNHPYDVAPLGTRRPYTEMSLALEDGDILHFNRISEGTSFDDAVYLHTDTSTRFYKSTIAWNGDGWTLKLADGSEMRFPEAYLSQNMAQGAAMEMSDAAGNKLQLLRDPARNLKEILTPHGHWIKFTYDDDAKITRTEDDSGKWVKYSYGAGGMLFAAVKSSGEERHYEYDGHLMTAITDEHGRTLLRNAYASDVLRRQEYANGAIYTYDYVWNAKRSYAIKVHITLPDGSSQDVDIGNAVPESIRVQQ